MATINRTPDKCTQAQNGSFGSWSGTLVYDQELWAERITDRSYRDAAYKVEFGTDVSISSCSIEALFKWFNVTGATIRCQVYLSEDEEPIGQLTFTAPSSTDDFTHRFSFSGLSGTTQQLIFSIGVASGTGSYLVTHPAASATYSLPGLIVNVTPASLYTGESVTLGFQRRYGETLTVDFLYNSTPLHQLTATADSVIVPCPASWFETAGVTAANMRVTVNVADTLGRTASTNFQLTQPQGSAASPVAPRSVRLEGANAINFSWSVNDAWGSQTQAELQWSDDNAIWDALGAVSGSDLTFTAPAVKFPAGTVYWRVRVTNSFGVVGAWSSSASFTVSYAATSQAVPVDSPTSGMINAGVARTFSVLLQASGPTYTSFTVEEASFFWRSGTSGAWTELSMTPNADRASVLIPAGTFPTGTVQWYASATDNTGRTTETGTYTLSTLQAPVEAAPLSPIDTVESGTSEIVFAWAYGSLDGSPQAQAQLAMSRDRSEWTVFATVTDADARSYAAPAATFEAGTVWWRVRAQSSAGTWSDWSAAVSFISFNAPTVAGVSVDSMPFATITWQVTGQMAYEIQVDDKNYGPWFGAAARSYTLPEPIAAGTHTARVQAQNQYGLWSEWAEAIFITGDLYPIEEAIRLQVETTESAKLTWTGGDDTNPVITVQPVSMSATEGLISFACDATGEGLTFSWLKKLSGESNWRSVGSGANLRVYTEPVSQEADGATFMCRVASSAGYANSHLALFTYAAPSSPPTVYIQPKDVFQKTGTVYIYCGATGSAYQWYRRSAQSGGGNDIQITDGGGNQWHIPGGEVLTGDILVSDGVNPDWHIPAGAGQSGDIGVNNDAWHLPSGPGSTTPGWVSMGVTTPYITFTADEGRSGEQFFCRVSNEDGSTDSAVAVYVFGDPPIEPGPDGDYYVYRDGVLLGRTEDAQFEDRTALGTHVYQIINRLSNNNITVSNKVTATVEVDCLVIAPLEGGDWLRLRLSEKQDRDLRTARGRQTAYNYYAGARFPEAEVGEQESLSGSFDVSWLYRDKEEAAAFEALLGRTVVVKSRRGVVIVGVLEGIERHDPRFWKTYTFSLQQEDWGGPVDA